MSDKEKVMILFERLNEERPRHRAALRVIVGMLEEILR